MHLSESKKAIDAVIKTALKETEIAKGITKAEDELTKEKREFISTYQIIAACTDKIMGDNESQIQEGWLALGGLRSSIADSYPKIPNEAVFEQFDILLEIFRRHWLEINDIKMN